MLLLCLAGQTFGSTPLYIASNNGDVKVVRTLLGAGAAVNQARVRDGLGPCGWSVLSASLCVRMLMVGCC